MPSLKLKRQALHGAFWSFAERFGQQGVQFFVSILLARVLDPKDFGLVAILAIFRALGQTCVDSGFSQALIWKQNLTLRDESTVFWFNLAMAGLMAVAFNFSAPWIATFFREPILVPMARVFALLLVVDSLGNVQNALLQKELAFQRRMLATLVSVLVSGAIGIGMAINGFGVWSLVGLSVSGSVSRVMMLWAVRRWLPLFNHLHTQIQICTSQHF